MIFFVFQLVEKLKNIVFEHGFDIFWCSIYKIRMKAGFEITTEIVHDFVHDSHDYHDKNFVVHDFVVHDFLVGQTIFDEIFDVKL